MSCPSSPARSAVVPLLCLALASCAGPTRTREQVLDDGFRRIQVHEARIDTRSATLTHAAGGHAPRALAADGICDEALRLCAIATELADADALARCGRAEDACRVARAHVRRRAEPQASK